MKLASLVLVLAACDGTGARSECAFGGALTDCPDAEHTVEAACWRLVDCGAIAVDIEDPMDDNPRDDADWGGCVETLERFTEDRQGIAVSCVAAATCDELRVDDFCFEFGR
ncbi:MAG: hypothetical protein ABI867_38370 [Kofleriaceae bacterium]